MAIIGGIIAPPAIEETIKPDNSLVYSGLLSIVIENRRGKILAKPRPVRKTPINVRIKELQKIKSILIGVDCLTSCPFHSSSSPKNERNGAAYFLPRYSR